MSVALEMNPVYTNNPVDQNLHQVQRTADEVLKLLVREKQILMEKVELAKKENRRDRNRGILEFYDRHFRKLMFGVGAVSLAAVFAAGISAYITVTNQPQAPNLTLTEMFAILSSPVTNTILAGTGLASLLVRAGYFIDCNGKFQEVRRGTDEVKQALVQIEDYERTLQLRDINQKLSTLPSERFRLREKWRVRSLMRGIKRRERQIKKYVDKMNKRDQKVLEKERNDIGGIPSNILSDMKTKQIALKEFENLGLRDFFGFFVDPRGVLPVKQETNKQQVFKKGKQTYKKIRGRVREIMGKSSPSKPLTVQEQRRQICQRMRDELEKKPTFSSLNALTQHEVDRTSQLLDQLIR